MHFWADTELEFQKIDSLLNKIFIFAFFWLCKLNASQNIKGARNPVHSKLLEPAQISYSVS